MVWRTRECSCYPTIEGCQKERFKGRMLHLSIDSTVFEKVVDVRTTRQGRLDDCLPTNRLRRLRRSTDPKKTIRVTSNGKSRNVYLIYHMHTIRWRWLVSLFQNCKLVKKKMLQKLTLNLRSVAAIDERKDWPWLSMV